MPVLDGAASVAIGVLLAGVATVLVVEIVESRSLLVGESVNRRWRWESSVWRRMIRASSAGRPLTMHFGPDDVLVTLDVQFMANASRDDIARAVERVERQIRARYPAVRRIYIEARLMSAVAQRPGEGAPAGGTSDASAEHQKQK